MIRRSQIFAFYYNFLLFLCFESLSHSTFKINHNAPLEGKPKNKNKLEITIHMHLYARLKKKKIFRKS